MQHWISTSAVALVIGSALTFPVGPAAAQRTMNDGGQAPPAQSDQGNGGAQSRSNAAESRGRSMSQSERGGMQSGANVERGQAGAQARTGAEFRGSGRADTSARGEASFQGRGTATTRMSRETSRTSRDRIDNQRFVQRDRFVERDRFADRDRGFVDRDRRFVDRDVRSRSSATYDDRQLNRRYVRGRTLATDGTDATYVRGGTRSFAYRSFDDEPVLHRAYGDTGYAYGPRFSDSYAYDGPVYGGGLFAYDGDTYMDNSLYLNADYDSTYSPVLNRAPCTCAYR